jgi:6-phosphogluconolactonase (cycloisomerase 2 family)
VNWLQDATGMYVLGRNAVGNDWQLNQMDQNLNILNTVTFTPADPGLGYAFLINGSLFLGNNYNSNQVSQVVNAATGAISNVNFSLDGLGAGGVYLSDFAYDADSGRLFAFNTNNRTLYVADNAATQFGVAPQASDVPEPASMLLLGTGLLGIAARIRHRKQTQ